MRDAWCYISIELNGDLAVDKPLAEISRLLKKLADDITTFDEDQNLDEMFTLRIGRKRVGQADLDVQEPGSERRTEEKSDE